MKKILFAASESVPFIKTGGLADVVGSLPKNFDKEEFDVRVILPKYACMKAEISAEEIDEALKVLVDDKKIFIGMNSMGEEYLYLYQYFSIEQNVIYQVKLLLEDKSAYCDENYVSHFLNNYTNGKGYQLDPLQKEAVLTALSSKIMILTGGPGTGKTATVNMIVECIEELTKEVHGRVPVIKLLAPTGKAAERMSEMTERTASTIHKELKILEETKEKQNEKHEKTHFGGITFIEHDCKCMGTCRTGGEKQHFSGRHLPLPFRGFQYTFTAEDIEGLLVFVVVMVRIGGFPRRDLIDTDHGIVRPAKGDKFTSVILVAFLLASMAGRNFVYIGLLDLRHTDSS